jgi:hypothetical protein
MLAATGAPRTLQYQRPKRDGCRDAGRIRALQSSPLKLRGWRAAWRNPNGIRDPCEPRRAPLRRATCAQAARRSRMLFCGGILWPRTALITGGTDARMEITHLTRRPTRCSAGGGVETPEAGTRLPGAGSGLAHSHRAHLSARLPRAPHLVPPSQRLAKAPLQRTRWMRSYARFGGRG